VTNRVLVDCSIATRTVMLLRNVSSRHVVAGAAKLFNFFPTDYFRGYAKHAFCELL